MSIQANQPVAKEPADAFIANDLTERIRLVPLLPPNAAATEPSHIHIPRPSRLARFRGWYNPARGDNR
jgi:hypothetical protein